MADPNITMTEICPTGLFYSINMVYNVYMYMILMTFLPFFLLSILNALIVKQVQNKARGLLREKCGVGAALRGLTPQTTPPTRSPVLVVAQHANNDVHTTLVRMEVRVCANTHTHTRSVIVITVHMFRVTISGVPYGQWRTCINEVGE